MRFLASALPNQQRRSHDLRRAESKLSTHQRAGLAKKQRRSLVKVDPQAAIGVDPELVSATVIDWSVVRRAASGYSCRSPTASASVGWSVDRSVDWSGAPAHRPRGCRPAPAVRSPAHRATVVRRTQRKTPSRRTKSESVQTAGQQLHVPPGIAADLGRECERVGGAYLGKSESSGRGGTQQAWTPWARGARLPQQSGRHLSEQHLFDAGFGARAAAFG